MQTYIFNNINYLIKIGCNKYNNWELLDLSNQNDILFHVLNDSSAYIILNNINNTKIKDIPRQVIKRCACLCKTHSYSANKKNVPIIYTKIEYCKKGEKIGSVFMDNIKTCII